MNDFDTAIQEIIAENVSILFEIERAIFTNRYRLSSKHQDIFAKQSIAMIYAMWEGFIQRAFNLYIDELNKVEIEFYTFSPEIVIHHMENSFRQFKEYPSKESQKIRFFQEIKNFHSRERKTISRIVNTQSNVSFNVLNNLLKTFSLEKFPEHWQEYRHPSPNLKDSMDLFLRLRNTVAHGGDLLSEETVNQAVYQRFKMLIEDLMYEIRLKMLEGLTNRTFLQRNTLISNPD